MAGLVNGFASAYGKLPSFIATLAMLSVARGLTLVVSDGRPISTPAAVSFLGGNVGPVPVPVIVLVVAAAIASGEISSSEAVELPENIRAYPPKLARPPFREIDEAAFLRAHPDYICHNPAKGQMPLVFVRKALIGRPLLGECVPSPPLRRAAEII